MPGPFPAENSSWADDEEPLEKVKVEPSGSSERLSDEPGVAWADATPPTAWGPARTRA